MYSSEECFCGSLYPGHPAREEDCDKTCKGNNSLMCGGGRRNSVYCVHDWLSVECTGWDLGYDISVDL